MDPINGKNLEEINNNINFTKLKSSQIKQTKDGKGIHHQIYHGQVTIHGLGATGSQESGDDLTNIEMISQIAFQIVVRKKVVAKVEIVERMKKFIILETDANKVRRGEFHRYTLTTDMKNSDKHDRNHNKIEICMEQNNCLIGAKIMWGPKLR